VVPRSEMRATLARICRLLMHAPNASALPLVEEPLLAAVAE